MKCIRSILNCQKSHPIARLCHLSNFEKESDFLTSRPILALIGGEKAFDMKGEVFSDLMLGRGDDAPVSLPAIGFKITAVQGGRDLAPKFLRSFPAPATDVVGNHQPVDRVVCNPYPPLVRLLLHERPQPICLDTKHLQPSCPPDDPDRQPNAGRCPLPENMGKRLGPVQADPNYPANGTEGQTPLQCPFDCRFCPFGLGVPVVQDKLAATALTLLVLLPIIGMAVLFYFCAVTARTKFVHNS